MAVQYNVLEWSTIEYDCTIEVNRDGPSIHFYVRLLLES